MFSVFCFFNKYRFNVGYTSILFNAMLDKIRMGLIRMSLGRESKSMVLGLVTNVSWSMYKDIREVLTVVSYFQNISEVLFQQENARTHIAPKIQVFFISLQSLKSRVPVPYLLDILRHAWKSNKRFQNILNEFWSIW